jgi:hypothetical protein
MQGGVQYYASLFHPVVQSVSTENRATLMLAPLEGEGAGGIDNGVESGDLAVSKWLMLEP